LTIKYFLSDYIIDKSVNVKMKVLIIIFFFADDSIVETECPVGTKCVADHFCNEEAVMVNYRVDLTPAQKRNRGKLIVSLLHLILTSTYELYFG